MSDGDAYVQWPETDARRWLDAAMRRGMGVIEGSGARIEITPLRSGWRVVCHTCGEMVHERTTGPFHNARWHMREAHGMQPGPGTLSVLLEDGEEPVLGMDGFGHFHFLRERTP